jgi:endothelin-converting enzyme/putative endopeptidase
MRKICGAVLVLGMHLLGSPACAETPAEILQKALPPVFDPAAIDQSVAPCEDFYQHACGAWLKANPVPPDRTRWSRYNVLDKHIVALLASVLEEAAAGDASGNDRSRKLGDYYATCMDEAAIEAKGLAPFAPGFASIDALQDKRQLAAEIARLHLAGASPLFSFDSAQDYTDATMMLAVTDQDGFALPDRDYYLTDAFRSERTQYREHLGRMFRLLGNADAAAEAKADAVLRVETALAKAAMGIVERREPKNVHHKMTLAALKELAPSFDWAAYLQGVGAPEFGSLDVADPDFFKGLEAALQSIPLSDWKAYLQWAALQGGMPAAPKALIDEDFDFFGKKLGGQAEIEARWKRCVGNADAQLGDALGQAYVERAFSPAAKERVRGMVAQIKKAMEARIDTLDWMSDATKTRAREKLAAVADKIGYPDKWLDYGKLEIVRGDALGNLERAAAFGMQRELAKIGKPVDRAEWSMSAPTNNAYYDAQLNDINFPAGVLQMPNFDMEAGDADNYGSLVTLIGHELTHGFDDEGRHYDASGNLTDWWTEEDAKAFEARAEGFVTQYDAYVAVEDPRDPSKSIHLDGKLTLGENTADNGGIRLGYEAFLATPAASKGPDSLGYTPSQRFFLSYAQAWCGNRTNEAAKEDAKTDPHAPGKYRVNGPLSNLLAFREAFACKAGAPMAPETMNRVW